MGKAWQIRVFFLPFSTIIPMNFPLNTHNTFPNIFAVDFRFSFPVFKTIDVKIIYGLVFKREKVYIGRMEAEGELS